MNASDIVKALPNVEKTYPNVTAGEMVVLDV